MSWDADPATAKVDFFDLILSMEKYGWKFKGDRVFPCETCRWLLSQGWADVIVQIPVKWKILSQARFTKKSGYLATDVIKIPYNLPLRL